MAIRLYLDTNVLCRPFDDQTIRRIRRETEAFERILEKIRDRAATLVASEILVFEIQRIVSASKKAKASGYLPLARGYHLLSEDTYVLAEEMMSRFRLEPRDALHVASALLGDTEYFLSCDDGITKRFRRESLSVRIGEQFRSLKVLNPEEFVKKMRW
ncbi:MAG: PIN domain-containing protein [Deltaproteobacteria bacterium]|nr:PIN domain-containing protein [Deltaproteobacteria bacterium]